MWYRCFPSPYQISIICYYVYTTWVNSPIFLLNITLCSIPFSYGNNNNSLSCSCIYIGNILYIALYGLFRELLGDRMIGGLLAVVKWMIRVPHFYLLMFFFFFFGSFSAKPVRGPKSLEITIISLQFPHSRSSTSWYVPTFNNRKYIY